MIYKIIMYNLNIIAINNNVQQQLQWKTIKT